MTQIGHVLFGNKDLLLRSFIILCMGSIFLISTSTMSPSILNSEINAIIGNKAIVNMPGGSETEKIKTHLTLVLDVLSSNQPSNLTEEQVFNRGRMMYVLSTYISRGVFPTNSFSEGRLPVFIDDEGNICAVGYLVENTKGRSVSESINEECKFSKVLDMNSPQLVSWSQEMGLHLWEAAMIQPQYSSVTRETQGKMTSIDIALSLGTTAMALSGGTYQLFFEPRPLVKRWIPMVGIGVGVTSLVHGLSMRRQEDVLKLDSNAPIGMTTNYVLVDNSTIRFMGLFNIAKGVVITSLNTYSLVRKTQNMKAQKKVQVTAIPIKDGALLSASLSF